MLVPGRVYENSKARMSRRTSGSAVCRAHAHTCRQGEHKREQQGQRAKGLALISWKVVIGRLTCLAVHGESLSHTMVKLVSISVCGSRKNVSRKQSVNCNGSDRIECGSRRASQGQHMDKNSAPSRDRRCAGPRCHRTGLCRRCRSCTFRQRADMRDSRCTRCERGGTDRRRLTP